MLSKAHRLNKQKDFDNVFRQGGIMQDEFLTIRFLTNRQAVSRFGLIVSTKTAKKAVARNHLRRQLSEAIRLNLERIKTGFDFVVVAKAKLANVDYQNVEGGFIKLLKKRSLYD